MKRDEYGSNYNPRFHSDLYSGPYGELVLHLETEIQDSLQRLCDLISTSVGDQIQKEIEGRVIQKWEECQEVVINFHRTKYSNWNPGLTAEGQPTYNYSEKPLDISQLNMADIIDQAPTSGNFTVLDDIFVKLCFHSLRHISHTGQNNCPCKKDYSYHKIRKIDHKRTALKRLGNKKAKAVYRNFPGCKRRKPQPLRGKAAIYKDPHDKKKIQLSFECNDGFFNGCDEIKVLHVLGNCDDKAILPLSFCKPPKITWEEGKPLLKFFTCAGLDHQEYTLKYIEVPPRLMWNS